MNGYFDRDGQPITQERWGELFGSGRSETLHPEPSDLWMPELDYSRIGWTKRGEVLVSTVWLGIDHGFGEGPPVIFETMVFGDPDHDDEPWRYHTLAEAQAGHRHVVRLIFGEDVP